MDGIKIAALENKPCIHGEDWIYDAWGELAGDRTGGMGPSPTPWCAVDQYARRYGILDQDFEVLVYCIRQLDMALIEFHEDSSAREAKLEEQKAKRLGKKNGNPGR